MEIKIAFKTPTGVAVNLEFACTAEETAQLINDPIYQQLGKVLVEHVCHENQQKCDNNADIQSVIDFINTEAKLQDNHNKATDAAIKNLQNAIRRLNKLL